LICTVSTDDHEGTDLYEDLTLRRLRLGFLSEIKSIG
jgi:hypothetical protein